MRVSSSGTVDVVGEVFPVLAAIFLFPVVAHCRTHLAAPYLGPANGRRGKNAVYAVEVWTLYVAVTVVQVLPVLAAIMLFRVLFNVTIAC